MSKEKNKYLDEEEYLEGIRCNDYKVIEDIIDTFEPRVIQYVIQNSGSKEDGEDVFMKALQIVFAKSQEGSLVLTSAFYTFLLGIVKYQWLNELRKRKRKKEVTFDKNELLINKEEVQVDYGEIEREILYREKFATLGTDCQKVLDMSLNEDKSMDQIADVMGYKSSGFARQKKHRCKEQLIKFIKSDPRFKELL